MKPRNPVAGNSWRYNKPKIIESKKKPIGRGRQIKDVWNDEANDINI